MIRAKRFSGEDLSPAEITALLSTNEPPSGVWVHAESPTDTELEALSRVFSPHSLALEDATEEGYWSRFGSYPQHDFITYRSLAEVAKRTTERVSIFIYPHALLTLAWLKLSYLELVCNMVGRNSVNTPAEITYELLDHGTDSFLLYAQNIEEQIDTLQERVFENPKFDAIPVIFELKRQLAGVRRLAIEGREATLLLTRHAQNVSEGELIVYRDALGNLERTVSRLEAQRESLTNLLDTYLGFQSQRMNQVMRALTVVSTIFLPLTFLAGVWGMNFKLMPELNWQYGYAMAWGSFLLTAALLAMYFKRRDWW